MTDLRKSIIQVSERQSTGGRFSVLYKPDKQGIPVQGGEFENCGKDLIQW